MNVPAVRSVLDPLLLRSLGLLPIANDLPGVTRWQSLWLRHWTLLPRVAGLIGAYLQFGALAKGAALRELSAAQVRFALCTLGPRAPVAWPIGPSVAQRADALGLKVLQSWHGHLAAGVLDRLLLQFSPDVVEWAATLPEQPMRPSLFCLAVQHARLHSTPS